MGRMKGSARSIVSSLVVVWCLALALGSWSPHAAQGQETAGDEAGDEVITLTVIPSNVGLAPGDRAEFAFVMTNSGATAVEVNSVRVQTPPRIVAVSSEPASPFSLGPGERRTQQFSVTAGYDAVPGDLTVVADVTAPIPDGSRMTIDRFVVATAGLELASPEGELVVSIGSAPSILSDGQSDGEMRVLVQNTTSSPLTGIELRPIESMDVEVVTPARPVCTSAPSEVVACVSDLEPGATEVVRVGLLVDDAVRTGKQQVGIVATATQAKGEVSRQLSSSATAEVELTVFGTAAVGPLGSTSLILLPAVVAFVVFLLLSRLVFPRTAWLPAKVDTGDFRWLVALLPIGAFIALVAWLILGVDISRESSTGLVVLLYGIGFAFGVLAWLLFASGYQQRTGRKLFKASDSPLEVLKRLEANDTTLIRPLVKGSTTGERVLGRGSAGAVAVSPTIMYDLGGLDDERRKAFSEAVTKGRPVDVLALLGEQTRFRRPGRKTREAPSLMWASGVRLVTDEPATDGRGNLMEEQ